jgi:hypothetical protein
MHSARNRAHRVLERRRRCHAHSVSERHEFAEAGNIDAGARTDIDA